MNKTRILWQQYYALLHDTVLQYASHNYLAGSAALGICSNLNCLHGVRKKIKQNTRWQVVLVDPKISTQRWFHLLSQKIFPIIAQVRSEDTLMASDEPDAFHDLLGHIPYFGDDEYIEALNLFSAIWCKHHRMHEHTLIKLWFYFFEFSVLDSKNTKVLGAGILSSFVQLGRVESCSAPIIEYTRDALLNVKISFTGEPERYMAFDSVKHMKRALVEFDRTLPAM